LRSPLPFSTTNWSVVRGAAGDESAVARDALAALCEAYWYPVYAYVRRRGYPPADAEDHTQAYFARFLEKGWVRGVRADRGRFRTFLLTSVRNFLSNERERHRATKRGGGKTILSLDHASTEGRYLLEPSDPVTPETLYERAWASETVTRALDRLQEEMSVAEGGRERFDQLKAHITGEDSSPAYREMAVAWKVSESTVRAAVHRLRKRLGRALRDEVATTVADPADVEKELRHLLAAMGG
jgi:RNA polymerase sigma-70 factor (ECF subfamily)